MKFLNTYYQDLFDSWAELDKITSGQYDINVLVTNDSYGGGQVEKNIIDNVSTTSIYIKVTIGTNRSGASDSPLCMNIQTIKNGVAGGNLTVGLGFSIVTLSNANNDFKYSISIPSTAKKFGNSGSNFYMRTVVVSFDTVQNIAEIYSDGISYGAFTLNNDGENIRRVLMGNLGASGSFTYNVAMHNIIISDTAFPITESVTEITPTISTTDWTAVDDYYNSDSVGDVMTLTASSGIDETARTVTGYSPFFKNCEITPTVNAVNIVQGNATQQLKVPSSNGFCETLSPFTVSQLSDISATITSSYISS